MSDSITKYEELVDEGKINSEVVEKTRTLESTEARLKKIMSLMKQVVDFSAEQDMTGTVYRILKSNPNISDIGAIEQALDESNIY